MQKATNMSQETPPQAEVSQPAAQPIPTHLPIELLPLYDWWKTNGSQFVVTLVAVAVLAGGAFAFKQYRSSRIASANKELIRANTLEELESAVVKFGSTQVGNAARLRLGKAYFDASRYEDALSTYDTCLSKGAPAGFAEIAQLGRAHALEALNRLDDALAAYEAFNKDSAGHFLQPQAQMGVARIYTLQGKTDEAKKRLENLKAQNTENASWEMAIANLEGVINRYEPRAARSLFDAADEAAKKTVPVVVPPPAAK
jgi:predicted negative regulator of RcsB-dependent stress response